MSANEASKLENLIADSAWGQIIGERKSQQDRAAIVNWPNGFALYILADGMGGHAGGAEASQIVVDTFRQHFIESEEDDIRQRFLHALEAANLAVFKHVQENPDLEGMGSTFLAVVFDGSSIRWISVGDSPLWLYREGRITQLNENHSMAAVLAKQVEEGQISQEEADTSPERSQLLEAVLGKDIKMVDVPEEIFPVYPGDVIMLASDGVETCSLEELQDFLAIQNADPDMSSEQLVAGILDLVKQHQRPGQDNSTVNVIRVFSEQEQIETVRPQDLRNNNDETQ